MNKTNSIKERFKVFFIGLFIIIFLLEVGLRFVGGIHLKKSTIDERSLSSGRDSDYTILFLGDSHTFGIGVPYEKNMPGQLQSLLDSKFKGKFIKVINKGVSAHNTAKVLNELDYNIDTIKPDLIILLIGQANEWNYWGYRTYLKRKSLFSILNDQLYRIRIYKLIKLLFLNIKSKIKDKLSPEKLSNNNPSRDRHYNRGNLFHKNLQFDIPDAWAYEDQGEYEEAIKRFKEGIKADPSNGRNYNGLGLAYEAQGDYEEAIKWFKEGIKADPKDNSNYNALGRAYEDRRIYAEAVRWFKEAIKVNPGDSNNYDGLGRVYQSQGDYAEAIRWFKEGIRLNPGDSNNYNGLGRAYRAQGNYAEAIKWFKEGIKMDPSNGHNYAGLGRTYELQGDYVEAIKWLKEGIKADPNESVNYGDITRIYRDTEGKYVEIMEFLRKRAKDNPLALNFIEISTKEHVGKEVKDWVKSDIEKIIKICQNQGIKIILQNYPFVQGDLYGGSINEVIREIAKEYSLPFVDNEQAFNELWNKGERKEDYFTLDEHCNDKGYGIIAKYIYDKIIEEKLINFDENR